MINSICSNSWPRIFRMTANVANGFIRNIRYHWSYSLPRGFDIRYNPAAINQTLINDYSDEQNDYSDILSYRRHRAVYNHRNRLTRQGWFDDASTGLKAGCRIQNTEYGEKPVFCLLSTAYCKNCCTNLAKLN